MTLIEKKKGQKSERGREWIFAFVKIQASRVWTIVHLKGSMWENNDGCTYTVIFPKLTRIIQIVLFAVLSGVIVRYLTE